MAEVIEHIKKFLPQLEEGNRNQHVDFTGIFRITGGKNRKGFRFNIGYKVGKILDEVHLPEIEEKLDYIELRLVGENGEIERKIIYPSYDHDLFDYLAGIIEKAGEGFDLYYDLDKKPAETKA